MFTSSQDYIKVEVWKLILVSFEHMRLVIEEHKIWHELLGNISTLQSRSLCEPARDYVYCGVINPLSIPPEILHIAFQPP